MVKTRASGLESHGSSPTSASWGCFDLCHIIWAMLNIECHSKLFHSKEGAELGRDM